MNAVTALVEALEAWDTRADVERCRAVEVAAREVGAGIGMTVSELLEAVAAGRREGAHIGQAVRGVATAEDVRLSAVSEQSLQKKGDLNATFECFVMVGAS